MARARLFTEDEQINMRLRHEAGESLRSIARDYDTSDTTIKRYVSEDYRIRHNAVVALAQRIRRVRAKQCPAS